LNAFEFVSIPRIVFGRGSFSRIGELALPFGKSAVVVTNADRDGKQGLQKKLAGLLDAAGIRHSTIWQTGEPTTAGVDKAVVIARAAEAGVLIALGGGSAIDAAKAISVLLTNGGEASDYMEVVGKGQKVTRVGVPVIAIPTTAGTGAEATRNAVIGLPEKEFKASIRSEHLLPRVALLDSELAAKVRPEITARCGMDALTQCIEAYTSKNAEPITDALALQGMMLAGRSLRRAFHHGADLNARDDMALAALFSGMALTNAGLGAVHGFAAPLGAKYPIPHGTVCAILLPHATEANIRAIQPGSDTHARYGQAGRVIGAQPALSDTAACEVLIETAHDLVSEFKIPGLASFGLNEQSIPELVALAQKSSSMRYNPVALSEKALAQIIRQAL